MKGIVYYTNNKCEKGIFDSVIKILEMTRLPIVSVSHEPMDFGYNIVVPFKSGRVSMFKQMVIGFKASFAETVFCCEHDVLYHPSHFDFTPERDDTFYFNTNVWTLDGKTGRALWYDDPKHPGRRMTSGLVANRELLIKHYEKKIKLIEKMGRFSHKHFGYAPGKLKGDRLEVYQSEHHNTDIKHDHNITKGRFDLSKFKCKEKIKDSWKIEDWRETSRATCA